MFSQQVNVHMHVLFVCLFMRVLLACIGCVMCFFFFLFFNFRMWLGAQHPAIHVIPSCGCHRHAEPRALPGRYTAFIKWTDTKKVKKEKKNEDGENLFQVVDMSSD